MSSEHPNFSDVMRSPYDDDGSDRGSESELDWKPPVIAAIMGAFLVSAFVIYAIVAGPTDDPAEVSSAPTDVESVSATGIPPGFTAFPSGNGARIEAVTPAHGLYLVGVSSAVAGSEVPSEVPPDQVAYWELRSNAGAIEMDGQLSTIGILGNTTVAFATDDIPGGSQLVAYVVADTVEHASDIEVHADLGMGETEFSIEVEPGVIINGVVTIGDGWGYVDWSLDGGVSAKLDVFVTFVGTDDPETDESDETQMIPGYRRTLSQGIGAIEAAPLYGFDGGYQLHRVGEPLGPANEPTAIVMNFDADVVTTVSDPVVVGVLPDS